jgi:hypothetical protein
MKRRTLLIVIVIISLLLMAVPANASTITMNPSTKVQGSVQIYKVPNTNLEEIINIPPEGHHDNFTGSQNQFFCRAEGWAADANDLAADLNIRIFSDGLEVAQDVAGTFRQDLQDAGVCVDGTCSFSVDLWGLISIDTDHLITVQAQDAQTGEWVDLFDTPRTLNCFEENLLPEGYHDGLNGPQTEFSCIAEGWATDPNDRSIDLTVRILSDGVEVAQTVANAFRQDLLDADVCPGGTCSFSVSLAGLIASDFDHSILVQAQDAQTGEWVDLYNSPKTLNCAESRWQQVNDDGFGDPQTISVTALEVFHGQLYAGTNNLAAGGQVWRWQRDGQWLSVSERGFGSGSLLPAVVDMVVFQGKLYAGIGWDDAPGQVWRSQDGTSWQPVTTDGFGYGGNIAITNFTIFKGMLYAGTGTTSVGAQIWRSKNGNSGTWTQVGIDGPVLFGNVTGFAVYKNVLYAAIEPAGGLGAPIQVWRSANGSDWVPVSLDGFGDELNESTGGFAQFRGHLYLGIRNDATGGQIWRTKDGWNWEQVVGDGFGNINNVKVESLLLHDGLLYAATFGELSGLEIWRSADGVSWEQISANGIGDSNNFATLWNNATVEYRGQIFIGTWNVATGGELWMSER